MNLAGENKKTDQTEKRSGAARAALDEKPFRLAKSFSLIAIVMIFASILTLTAMISRQAEIIITKRVEDDTLKLMENLNHQMYINFLAKVATDDTNKKSQLRLPWQREELHRVITNTIYGFDLQRVLIYNRTDAQVVYDTDMKLMTSFPDGAVLDSYNKAIDLYLPSIPDRSAQPPPAPWWGGGETSISFNLQFNPQWSADSGLKFNPSYENMQEPDGMGAGGEGADNENTGERFFPEISIPASETDDEPDDDELSTRSLEDAYLDNLRTKTVFIYEGGSYLFWSFMPRGNFVLRSFKAMDNPTVTYEDSYKCLADITEAGPENAALAGLTPEVCRRLAITGVLEVDRDLTPEYRQIARLQYFALSVAIILSLGLTFVLFWVVRRGEAIINKRNQERQALREQLDQAERLAGLGSMVATVAHEIRNPLGIIHSTADVLNRFLADEPDRAKLAGAIVEEADRLSEVVTEFLDFARPPVPKMDPMVVEDILEEILAFLEVALTRAGVEVRTIFRDQQSPTPGDASMLHRAFLNLLVNAVQAMTDGGLITVKTAMFRDDRGAEKLMIEICDTGPGLSEDSAKKMFSPFYTTKAKGTGLGLVIVKNIIEGHGGEISLRNGQANPRDADCGPGLIVTIILNA
ncbi:hypothetical protein LJB99_01745 [Deltaproteobacteria bacterium OttesenSCG-928-K17]|nr:hypothetical protein [Deltaproteobacteria bacterium OttesenSCG-928-K17]